MFNASNVKCYFKLYICYRNICCFQRKVIPLQLLSQTNINLNYEQETFHYCTHEHDDTRSVF